MNKFSVIGLGSAGCALTDEFKALDPLIKTFKIDCEEKKEKNYFKIKKYTNPEEYDALPPNVSKFLKTLDEEVVFIVSGGGVIAGASLGILEQIKEKKIHILYIRPDLDFYSDIKKFHEATTYRMLQEYVYYGDCAEITLISNPIIEEIIGDTNIKDTMKVMNKVIAWTYYTFNDLKLQKPLVNNFSSQPSPARINTLGAIDLKTGEEKLFFPLDFVSKMEYYYVYQQEEIETNNKLLKEVKNQLRQKKNNKTQICYGIYSSEHQYKQGICAFYSEMVQKDD